MFGWVTSRVNEGLVEPTTVNVLQETPEEQVAVDVPTDTRVLLFATYANCPAVQAELVASPENVSVRSPDNAPPPESGYEVFTLRVVGTYEVVSTDNAPVPAEVLINPFVVRLERVEIFCEVLTLNALPEYDRPVQAVVVEPE